MPETNAVVNKTRCHFKTHAACSFELRFCYLKKHLEKTINRKNCAIQGGKQQALIRPTTTQPLKSKEKSHKKLHKK
jgi:hypothetical protein